MKSHKKHTIRNMFFSTPFSKSFSFFAESIKNIPSRIIGLFKSDRPFTIRRRIVSIVINTLNGVFLRRAFSHISNKSSEVVFPLITNYYTSAAIILKGWMIGIKASAFNVLPNYIFSRSLSTMSKLRLTRSFSLKASTTLCISIFQMFKSRKRDTATIASTLPKDTDSIRYSFSDRFNYYKATKSLTSNINKLHTYIIPHNWGICLYILLIISLIFTPPAYSAWRKTNFYDSKPCQPVQIDWGNPLTYNLVACWLMNTGGGVTAYDIVNNNNGAITGATWSPSAKGGGLSFTGGTSYINCGAKNSLNFTTQNFTIAFLMNSTSASNEHMPVCKGVYGGEGYYMDELAGAQHAMQLIINTNYVQTANNTISPGIWYQVVGIRNGTNPLKIYLNGIEPSYAHQDNGTNPTTSADNFYIGKYQSGSYNYNGMLIYVYIWARALNQSEIYQLYSNPYQIFVAPRWGYISPSGGAAALTDVIGIMDSPATSDIVGVID